MVYCGILQIVRPHRGITYLPYWEYWLLFLSWRVWGGIWIIGGLSYVDHILAVSSLVKLAPITSFYTSSRLMGISDGISVGVRRYYPASGHWSFPRMRIFHLSPQGDSLVHSFRVVSLGRSEPFWYLVMYTGDSCPFLSSIVGTDGSGEVPGLGAKVGSLVFFVWMCGLLGELQGQGFAW